MPIQKNSVKFWNILFYFFPAPGCFPELFRTASVVFTEAFTEIGGICKACFFADLYDFFVGGTQKFFGLFQAKLPDKVGQTLSCFFLKYVTHISR